MPQVKRQRLSYHIKYKLYSIYKGYIQKRETERLKVKEWKKYVICRTLTKRKQVYILLSDKIDFKT